MDSKPFPDVSSREAFEVARRAVGSRPESLLAGDVPEPELGIWPTAGGGALAWRVLLSSREPVGTWEVVVDTKSADPPAPTTPARESERYETVALSTVVMRRVERSPRGRGEWRS